MYYFVVVECRYSTVSQQSTLPPSKFSCELFMATGEVPAFLPAFTTFRWFDLRLITIK
jgi:hypothetical protein